MSSLDEIKSGLQESLAAGMEKSIDEANLRADDILAKTGDYTNPRHWYHSNYAGHMIRLMARSSTSSAYAAALAPNDDDDGKSDERSAFTADEQVLRNLRNLEELDRELRRSYRESTESQRPRGKVGKKGKKGKLVWKRRQTWPQACESGDVMANGGHAVSVTVDSSSTTLDSPRSEQESNPNLTPGERPGGLPSPISTEMEQYRMAKGQTSSQDQKADTEEVLEAYNRKPNPKVDTLPNIHAHFLPREQRANNIKPNASVSFEDKNDHEAALPSIEIDMRKSGESPENGERGRTKKKVRHRPVHKDDGDKVQLPMIDDLVRVRELRRKDPSHLTETDRQNREYVNGWIHKLNRGASGKTRAKKDKFQKELKRNLDPGMYKGANEKKDVEPKPNHVFMLPDNPLAPLPQKYPELTKNEKPFAGMYFHTLRQKSAYQLKMKQMNKSLRRYRRKEVPRTVSSGGSSTSDFNSKISKVENKIDAIGSEIGKLYHSTASLQRIVNRDAPKSKSEATSTRDELAIDATPVPLSPVKRAEVHEPVEQTTKSDQNGGGDRTEETNYSSTHVNGEDSETLVQTEQGESTESRQDGSAEKTKEETDEELLEDKDKNAPKYSNDKIVVKEKKDNSKLSVVTLEMDKSRTSSINTKDPDDSAANSVFSMATAHTGEAKDDEGSEEAANRLLSRKTSPKSPVKEPMKKFNKLEPFNEKRVDTVAESDDDKRKMDSGEGAKSDDVAHRDCESGNVEGNDVSDNVKDEGCAASAVENGGSDVIGEKTGVENGAQKDKDAADEESGIGNHLTKDVRDASTGDDGGNDGKTDNSNGNGSDEGKTNHVQGDNNVDGQKCETDALSENQSHADNAEQKPETNKDQNVDVNTCNSATDDKNGNDESKSELKTDEQNDDTHSGNG